MEGPTSDRILDLTLEIITLLTGEVYSLVKTKFLLNNIYPPISTKWPKLGSSLSSLTPGGNLEQKILEVTKSIAELLTGEELNGHKELYQAAMMEPQASEPRPRHGERSAPPPRKKTGFLSGEERSQKHQRDFGTLYNKRSDPSDVTEERNLGPPSISRDLRKEPAPRHDISTPSDDAEPHLDMSPPIPSTRVPSSRGPLQLRTSSVMDSQEGPLISSQVSRSIDDIKMKPMSDTPSNLPPVSGPASRDCLPHVIGGFKTEARPVHGGAKKEAGPWQGGAKMDAGPGHGGDKTEAVPWQGGAKTNAGPGHSGAKTEARPVQGGAKKEAGPGHSGAKMETSPGHRGAKREASPGHGGAKKKAGPGHGGVGLHHPDDPPSSDHPALEEPYLDKCSPVPVTRVPSSRAHLMQVDSFPDICRSVEDIKLTTTDLKKEPQSRKLGSPPLLTGDPSLRDSLLQGISGTKGDFAPSVADVLLCEVGNLPPASIPALKGDLLQAPAIRDSFMCGEELPSGPTMSPSAHTMVNLHSLEAGNLPPRGLPAPSGSALLASDHIGKMAASPGKPVDTNNSRTPVQSMSIHIKEEVFLREEDGGLPITDLPDRYPSCQIMSSQIKEEPCSWDEEVQSRHPPGHPFYTSETPYSNEETFSCSRCGKTFLQRQELDLHFKTHFVEKRYSCPHCGKTFRQKSDSDNHMRVHTGERPFPCAICGKCFTTRSDRAKHHRIHTGERRFRCSLCGKGFIQKVALDKHIRVHTGEKPYSCQYCGKRFSEKSNVARHLRVHTGGS